MLLDWNMETHGSWRQKSIQILGWHSGACAEVMCRKQQEGAQRVLVTRVGSMTGLSSAETENLSMAAQAELHGRSSVQESGPDTTLPKAGAGGLGKWCRLGS